MTRRLATALDAVPEFLGMNSRKPAVGIDARFSPLVSNVTFGESIVESRHGYSTQGACGSSNCIMSLFEHETSAGTRYLVAVTSDATDQNSGEVYKYDPGSETWVDITPVAGALTGDVTDLVDHVRVFDGSTRRAIFTNGVDVPLVWDASMANALALDISDFSGLTIVKSLAFFYNHLIFANYNDGSWHPQGIAWTNVNTLTDWTGGTSGLMTLGDLHGEILRMLPLGNSLVVYTRDSIGMIHYLGGDYIYGSDLRVGNVRVASKNSIVDLGPFHVFLGEDNFYLFDGSMNVRAIGDDIADDLRDTVDLETIRRCYAADDRINQRVLFFVGSESGKLDKVYVLEYNLSSSTMPFRWSKFEFQDEVSSASTWSRDSALSWANAKVAADGWDDVDYVWSSTRTRGGFPGFVYGTAAGEVFLLDDTVWEDSGTAIDSYWQSKDFSIPTIYRSREARWLEVEAELKGTFATLSYSTDGGTTWTEVSTATLASGWDRYRFYFDTSAQTLRLRVASSSGSRFSLRWLRVWFNPQGGA